MRWDFRVVAVLGLVEAVIGVLRPDPFLLDAGGKRWPKCRRPRRSVRSAAALAFR
jgi:hypothetical protein